MRALRARLIAVQSRNGQRSPRPTRTTRERDHLDAARALDQLRDRVVQIEALVAAVDDRIDAIPYVRRGEQRQRLRQLVALLGAARAEAAVAVEMCEHFSTTIVG
jgi:hypothetical protein